MSVHLERDLHSLHRDLLQMGGMVEELVRDAVDILSDPEDAPVDALATLENRDTEIDEWDVKIENEALKMLALHQPVAVDLRRIAMVLRIANELERVADLAVHIGERAAALRWQTKVQPSNRLRRMSQLALDMLHRSIDAYVELDSQLARRVIASDDLVDETNREIIEQLIQEMRDDPEAIEPALQLFGASRHVERMADHATNIAEDVVYLVEGTIIRHARKLQESASARDDQLPK